MYKVILITMLVFLLNGCGRTRLDDEPSNVFNVLTSTNNSLSKTPKIMIWDRCEYGYFEAGMFGSGSYSLTVFHKGNCKNPVHIYK